MLIKLYEKYKDIKYVKEEIMARAINTENLDIIKFFESRGYDFNNPIAMFEASFNEDIFEYLLNKKFDIENYMNNNDFSSRAKEPEVQKKLIDFGYDGVINRTVGFNDKLRNDPKYKHIIDMYNDMSKFNL